MDIVAAIEMTAGAISRAEDRKERLSLYLLAVKLHDLYIPPNEAASVIGAMATDELRPGDLRRIYERLVRNGPEIHRLLTQLDHLYKTRGRSLFPPSEMATIKEAIDLKRGLRVEMFDIFRAYQVRVYAIFHPYIKPTEEEAKQWSLPEYTPESIARIKADTRVLDDARSLQRRIERLSAVLDAAFNTLASPVERSGPRTLSVAQVALLVAAGFGLWILGAVSSKLTDPFISSIAEWLRGLVGA